MSTPKLFSASINEEGASNVKRGKIPSGLINAMGGQKGDMLQFEVTGKFITGGRILKGKAADEARAQVFQQSRTATPAKPKAQATAKTPAKPTKPTKPAAQVKPQRPSAPAKTPAKPQRPVAPAAQSKPQRPAAKPTLAASAAKVAGGGKKAAPVAPKKVAAPAAKGNGRKTSVAYETPAKPTKAGSAKPKFSLSK